MLLLLLAAVVVLLVVIPRLLDTPRSEPDSGAALSREGTMSTTGTVAMMGAIEDLWMRICKDVLRLPLSPATPDDAEEVGGTDPVTDELLVLLTLVRCEDGG